MFHTALWRENYPSKHLLLRKYMPLFSQIVAGD